MKRLTILRILNLHFLILCASFSYGQIRDTYAKAEQLALEAAKKYDALNCTESANYCRKIAAYNRCQLNRLSDNPNTQKNTTGCGIDPNMGTPPFCEAAQPGGSGGKAGTSASTMNPIQQMRAKEQQSQQELTNAQNASMSAYQQAINSGRKESGAMLDATFAGMQQISDQNAALVYTGIGLGISLFMHLSEKKAEHLQLDQKQLEIQKEKERKRLLIDAKSTYINEALNINQYSFTDLISKDRYATLLTVPKHFDSDEQNIYFTNPVKVDKYSDDTYPLKNEIENKILKVLNNSLDKDQTTYILYPITNLEKFISEFIKKMGSGKVINLNAKLLTLSRPPFESTATDDANGATDFWGNPIKKDSVNKPKANKDDYWEKHK